MAGPISEEEEFEFRLRAEQEAASTPQRKPAAPKPAKPQGFFNKLSTGVSRLPALVGLNKDISPGEAAGTLAKGAAEGLMAAGRGVVGGVGGKTGEDIFINAPIAIAASGALPGSPEYQDKLALARAQGDRLAKEQPVADVTGNVIGFAGAGGALRNATGMGIVKEGAAIGGLSALADQRPEDAIRDAAIGGVVAKVAEPAVNLGAKIVATGAQKGASIVNTVLGKGTKGPLNEKTLRGIANRTQVDSKTIKAAYDEFAKYNPGQAASFAEIADTATINRFADMAQLRRSIGDDRMGVIYRDFEDATALARPGNIRSAVAATGPTQFAPNVRAGLDDAATASTRSVKDAKATDIENLKIDRDLNIEAIDDVVGANTQAVDDAARIGRQELKQSIDLDPDIDAWASETLRSSGLSDKPVTITTGIFDSSISRDAILPSLKRMLARTPEKSRGPLSRAIEAIEGVGGDAARRTDAILSVSDLDVVRRAMNAAASKSPEDYALFESAKILTDVIEKQVPGYKGFLDNYSLAKEAAEGFAKFQSAFGSVPDVARFAGQIAESKAQVVQAMGPRGEQVVKSIEASMSNLSRLADEANKLKAAAQRARGTTKADADAAIKRVAQMADDEVDRITKVLRDNKEAVAAADNILTQTTGRFTAAISRAQPDVPLGDIARGAVADRAGQSVSSAVTTARELSDSAVGDRLAAVVGDQAADAITGVGRTQFKAAKNIASLPTERLIDPVIPTPGALALDALGGAAGRPGPGYKVALLKKGMQTLNRLGLRGNDVTDIAEAVIKQDDRAVEQIIARLGKNEENVLVAVNEMRGALQATRDNITGDAATAAERKQRIDDLVFNGYTVAEAEEIVRLGDELDAKRGR